METNEGDKSKEKIECIGRKMIYTVVTPGLYKKV